MWRKIRRHLNVAPLRSVVFAAWQLHDRWADWRLNVDTRGARGEDRVRGRFADALKYEPLPYMLLARYARFIRPTPDDVVYDIGCGAGRVLYYFSRLGVKECVGIELSPPIVQLFRANADRFRGGKCPVHVVQADAAEADYSRGTIYWLYNPFGADTLKAVLERIRLSLDASPRRIQLVYAVPKHEWVLAQCGWLKCVGRDVPPLSDSGVSCWRNEVSVPQAPAAQPNEMAAA